MLSPLLLAAALGSLPIVIPTTAVIRESDYPVEALKLHQTGLARTDVIVGTNGIAIRCDLVGTSGSSALDKKSCLLIMHRFMFKPGHDEAGELIVGVGRVTVNWAISDAWSVYSRPTDMVLPVDHLPQLAKPPVTTVKMVLEQSGHVATCEIDASSGLTQLDRLACATVSATAFPPIRDATDTAVKGVRAVTIEFSAPSTR